MTIIQNKNTISTTIGELMELIQHVKLHYGDDHDTIINIEIDDRGNGNVSSVDPRQSNILEVVSTHITYNGRVIPTLPESKL